MTGAKTVGIIGGSVSGLAAATKFTELDEFSDIVVFERQRYDDKRVDCGEAINDTSLIPLEKTTANGFVNDIDGFQLRVYNGQERSPASKPLGVSNLACELGYICERDVVERRWAEKLASKDVDFRTGHSISPAEFEELTRKYDYIIDASGQPALTTKARGQTGEYTGDMVALNATVEGDFADYLNRPRIFFEGYVGYAWSFPKSETHANVGIGWAGDQRPDNYIRALTEAAERNGFPVPDREDVNIYTIPRGPSINPEKTHYPEENILLVGDAAGVANRYQGEGICQGIRTAYLAADLIHNGHESTYPQQVYELMKSEYRLAHLMRGAWVEHEDPHLLAAVAESLEGLTIEEITRRPNRVIWRVLNHPQTAARLLASSGMIHRLYDAYTDSWEYSVSA
ncbi:MAG: NAD(P)/FAD-dependent oxidoreductase [Halobacteriota archaeon]